MHSTLSSLTRKYRELCGRYYSLRKRALPECSPAGSGHGCCHFNISIFCSWSDSLNGSGPMCSKHGPLMQTQGPVGCKVEDTIYDFARSEMFLLRLHQNTGVMRPPFVEFIPRLSPQSLPSLQTPLHKKGDTNFRRGKGFYFYFILLPGACTC